MANCIAFHSYKGGTGKTTIAANFAASLANRGYHVFLLDLDIYAPSLQSYFEKEPKKWINDFLYSNAELEEVLTDLTPTVIENDKNNSENIGKKIRRTVLVSYGLPSPILRKKKYTNLKEVPVAEEEEQASKILQKYSFYEGLYSYENN